MAKTLIMHIGFHKTGSTSIQHYFEKFFGEDNETGIYYTRAGRGDSLDHKRMHTKVPDCQKHWTSLYNDVSGARDNSTIVISAENFSWGDPAEFYELAKPILELGVQFKIVGYIRPHISAITAHFSQMAKHGKQFDLEKFIYHHNDRKKFHYCDIYDGFAEYFGEQAIIYRPFIREFLTDQDVVADLLGVIGKVSGMHAPRHPLQDANVGAGARSLSLIKHAVDTATANGVIAEDGSQTSQFAQNMHRSLAPYKDLIADKPKVVVPQELKKAMVDMYIEDARRLDGMMKTKRAFARALKDYEPAEKKFSLALSDNFSSEEIPVMKSYIDLFIAGVGFGKTIAEPDPPETQS